MNPPVTDPGSLLPTLAAAWPGVRLGADIAAVAPVADAIRRFGDAYLQRLFTKTELADCSGDHGPDAARLAARFAAKEAVIKALDLAATGLDWRDIEVVRQPGGGCCIRLGGMLALQQEMHDISDYPASLSHDGDYALALVAFPPVPQ